LLTFNNKSRIIRRVVELKLFGQYSVHIWCIFGSFLVYIWFIFSPYLVHIWSIFGPYSVHIRSILGPLFVYICSILGPLYFHIYSPGPWYVYITRTTAEKNEYMWIREGSWLMNNILWKTQIFDGFYAYSYRFSVKNKINKFRFTTPHGHNIVTALLFNWRNLFWGWLFNNA